MHDAITYRGAVYPWHCDHMGHMNVMWYVGKFDEAVWNLMTRLGLTPAWLRERRRGMAAVEQTIRYEGELHAGDVVSVRSVVAELRERVLLIDHTMRDAASGQVAATMRLTAVHLDTVARRAVPFPPDIAAAIRADMSATTADAEPCA
jgi:acyl-CoA thioester hydrolase